MKKPTKPCYVCGSSDWWHRPDGGWACGKCLPNPNPSSSPNSGEEGHALEVLALRDRIRQGNDKLSKARLQIQNFEEGEEKERQWDRWNEAQVKLRYLCSELQIKGYHDCLYIENGKRTKNCLSNPDGFECQGCPSSVPYWEKELMALPGPKRAKSEAA